MGQKASAVRMGDESTSWNGIYRSYMYEVGDFELDHINKAISRSKFTRHQSSIIPYRGTCTIFYL
jgi:hypothetical protein